MDLYGPGYRCVLPLQGEAFALKAGRIRGSVMLIGPLLARFGKALLPKPGG